MILWVQRSNARLRLKAVKLYKAQGRGLQLWQAAVVPGTSFSSETTELKSGFK